MLYPPTLKKPVRLTIPVSPEVHEAFQRLAKVGNMSTGRAMGEWLADTLDAANFMATTMEKARAAPKLVAQELHAYALGLGDETGALIERMREKGRETAAVGVPAQRGHSAAGARTTPPSNPGVTTVKNKPSRGKK